MNTADLLPVMVLYCQKGLSNALAKKLLNYFKQPEAVVDATSTQLKSIPWFPQRLLSHWNWEEARNTALKQIEAMHKHGVSGLTYTDVNYPSQLKHCIDGPIILFYKGRPPWQKRRWLSIVGTRKMTTYGQQQCAALVQALRPYDPVIVSGLAFGIDVTAHQAALANGMQTVACLAQGLDQVYPKRHTKIAGQIAQQGGLLSETLINAGFHNRYFIRRNRIIAGLSTATIVVESAERGGSLTTAEMAFSYNREVYAVPGRLTDSQSAGCNSLISKQLAQVYTSVEDLVSDLGWDQDPSEVQTKLPLRILEVLKPEEQMLLALFDGDAHMHIEQLRILWKGPSGNLAAMLLSMELKGWIKPLPGQLFKKV
ncbi:DNA-processing protein DprA [Gilvibacter sediminis]|uniref:DNA-processing protein DprA n=1 Tax=Gilvibacter sediminis TaxID=379071 RepID=UPI002350475D|nr:DNA-processing protein DprA [Gilvibacter sediminis]MDC7996751.1 DNA-processing protein DprA [Gilvibacter sediminis]